MIAAQTLFQGLVAGRDGMDLARVVSVNLFESSQDPVVVARPVFHSRPLVDWHDAFFVRPRPGAAFHQLCGVSGMKDLGNIPDRGAIRTGNFTARAPEIGMVWLSFERGSLMLNQTLPPYDSTRFFRQRILTDPAEILELGLFLLAPPLPCSE